MSEFSRVYVRRVPKLTQVEGTDFLMFGQVDGLNFLVHKIDGAKEGELAIVVPFDMVVPNEDRFPEFVRGQRIRPKKLRGVVSMCVLLPAMGYSEDDDVTEELGFIKWEPPAEDDGITIQNGFSGREIKGPFELLKYDIESLARYHTEFKEGEDVLYMEKIEGCVHGNTNIRMGDGSSKTISSIKVGDEVLGYDTNKNIVQTKVLAIQSGRSNKEWRRISFKKDGIGLKGGTKSITCTNNHEFFNGYKYISAERLNIGDKVMCLKYRLDLCQVQKSILLGKLLGDGNLRILPRNEYTTANIRFGHSIVQKDYIEWTINALGAITNKEPTHGTSGHGSEMLSITTVTSSEIYEQFKDMVVDGKKIFPSTKINDLDIISIAYWYMDDGSLEHTDSQEDRVRFSTCSFDDQSISNLIMGLGRFGIVSKKKEYSGYPYIIINAENSDKMFSLISPYIPPSMQYKLPEKYRGNTGWIPKTRIDRYISHVIPQTIKNIEKTPKYREFDIQTETGNFFANGLLAHNSNIATTFYNNKFWVKSRNRWIEEGDSMWWTSIRKYDWEFLRDHPGLVVFGELYGGFPHFRYDCKDGEQKICAFDIYDATNRKFFLIDEFLDFTDRHNIITAPTLARGPWQGIEHCRGWAEAKPVLGGDIREGFVVRSDQLTSKWERKIFKLHSNKWLIHRGKIK